MGSGFQKKLDLLKQSAKVLEQISKTMNTEVTDVSQDNLMTFGNKVKDTEPNPYEEEPNEEII